MTEDLKKLVRKEKELASATATIAMEKRKSLELESANKKLKEMQNMLIQAEKLNAVGQLASGVAHEVKNPLGIIMQGVGYLARHLPKEKRDQDVLNMIKANIKRADNIICTLVDFSRAAVLNPQPEQINPILENSLLLIQHRIKLEEIEIIKDLEDGLPKVFVDKGKMEQVFVNIFLNSIQAMPHGGKLIIRSYLTQMKELKNKVGRRNEDRFKIGEKAIIVEIRDTGMGMSEEVMKNIFDPFFTTKGPQEGTGLGLSVTRNIIDMHNGILEMESEEGKSTKATIILRIFGE